MKVTAATVASFLVSMQVSRAQFSPAFLQNESYWSDGKAEVDFYDAQVMRDGQLRHCELQVVLVASNYSPAQGLDEKATSPAPAVSAIRLSQQLTIPLGLISEDRSSVSFFARDGRLLKTQVSVSKPDELFSATAAPRVSKPVSPLPGTSPIEVRTIDIHYSKATGDGLSTVVDSAGDIAIMREELPLRVRTVDFSKPAGEFSVKIWDAESAGQPAAKSAVNEKLVFKSGERDYQIDVGTETQRSHFVVDRDFPFLLREWKTADGSTYKLKNSLKVDYQKYLKEGDREKAMKDPMLRHPD